MISIEKKRSETSWEMVTCCSDHNEYGTLVATEYGLKFGSQESLISWEELDKARDIATKKCMS
jgi:hypothetical protein